MTIADLRKEIDELDEQLLKTLAKRMSLALEVAKHKKENGIPLKQPEREEQLVSYRKQMAKELGLSENFVEELWKAIIKESLRIEEK